MARFRITAKWTFWLVIGAAAVVTLGFVIRPEAVWVDLAPVERGPLEVTIVEEGKTRVQDRYLVSAPVSGFLHRVQLEVGDKVVAGDPLSWIDPSPASILDARSRAEAEARAAAAAATLKSARERVRAAEAEAEFASNEYQRLLALEQSRFISLEQLQQARAVAARSEAFLQSARFDEEVAAHELTAARTRLDISAEGSTQDAPGERVAIRSPVDGTVLSVVRENEGVIQTGEPIVEIGDSAALEIVVDVLSFDAVKLEPGLRTRLIGWGGPALEAAIRRIEPIGFEDISALGVEERRVRVIADMVSPRDQWETLGDGYRVDAEFVLWQAEAAVQVPKSAVFQSGHAPSVFVVSDGRAHLQAVKTGRDNGLLVQIVEGLHVGQKVVRHPGLGLEDGDQVRER